MPELPEVETVVRDLRPLLVGRTLLTARHSAKKLRRPWNPAWGARVAGARVEAIRRRGKWILVDLVEGASGAERPTPPAPLPAGRGGKEGGVARATASRPGGEYSVSTLPAGRGAGGGGRSAPEAPSAFRHGSFSPLPFSGEGARSGDGVGSSPAPLLRVHLGMTGQFTVVPAAEPAPDHLHLAFALDDGHELRFRDQRRFGSAEFFPDRAAVEAQMNAELGPEPFGLDPEYFRDAVRGSKRNLKAILLDQTIVAGVGNIYADEACFRAGLHPGRKGSRLTRAECDSLREAVEAVLIRAIGSRGSTIRDYVGGSGLRGGFQNEFAVYGRTGEPCPTCEAPIALARYAGRSSHYCPSCQKGSTHHKGTKRARRNTEKAPDRV